MKQGLLTAAMLLCAFYAAVGQGANKKDILSTNSRQADFKIYYALTTGGFSIKLFADYSEETDQYRVFKVKGDTKAEKAFLVLDDPLNYEVFSQLFYDSLKVALNDNTLPALSNSSIQSVYTWLYTLRTGNEDDIVNSGNLWLRRWVMAFGKGESKSSMHKYQYLKERIHLIDSITNIYNALDAYTISLKNDLDSEINLAIEKISDTRTEEADTIAKQKIYQTTKVQTEDNDRLLTEFRKDSLALDKNRKDVAAIRKEIPLSNKERKDKLKADIAKNQEVVKNVTAALKTRESFTPPQLDSLKKDSLRVVGVIGQLSKTLDSLPDSNKPLIDSFERVLSTMDSGINNLNEKIKSKSKDQDELTKNLANSKTALETAKKKLDDKKRKLYSVVGSPLIILTQMQNKIRNGTMDDSSYAYDRRRLILSTNPDPLVNGTADSIARRFLREKNRLGDVKRELRKRNIYHINRISLQVERGALERIQVWLDNTYGGEDIYENVYPFGMTSINNLKSFSMQQLILRPFSHRDFVMLSDVLGNYDNFLNLFTRDYSPADTEINNIIPAETPCVMLRKERLVKLFDSKIYTDLEGLRADRPAGLVQLEIQRRFNIHTTREKIGRRNNMSYFNYMNTYAAMTKIEQKDRRLQLRNENIIQNGKIISPSYATNLDFREYENASLGLDLNLLLFDNPDGKFTFYANVGARYGHTSLVDTMRTITNGKLDTPGKAVFFDSHTVTYALPKLSMEFFSERRVGLTLSWQYNMTYYFSNNHFKPVVSYAKSDLTALPIEKFAHYSHMFEFYMRVEISKSYDSRMFLRARYFMQRGDINTFFPQIQLGYAYNLVLRK